MQLSEIQPTPTLSPTLDGLKIVVHRIWKHQRCLCRLSCHLILFNLLVHLSTLSLLELGDPSANSSDDTCKLVARNAGVVCASLVKGILCPKLSLVYMFLNHRNYSINRVQNQPCHCRQCEHPSGKSHRTWHQMWHPHLRQRFAQSWFSQTLPRGLPSPKQLCCTSRSLFWRLLL